jgi:hypothetical protein
LKTERWGSLLVQENNQEEKACDKRRIIIIIIQTMFIAVPIRDNEMCYFTQSIGRDSGTGWTVP